MCVARSFSGSHIRLWVLAGMQFPKAILTAGAAPMMLKSQLYTIVTDRTAVDRELEALRHAATHACTDYNIIHDKLESQIDDNMHLIGQ